MARNLQARGTAIGLFLIVASGIGPSSTAGPLPADKHSQPAVARKPRDGQPRNAGPAGAVRKPEIHQLALRAHERSLHKKLATRVTMNVAGKTFKQIGEELAKAGGFDILFDPVAVAAGDISLHGNFVPEQFTDRSIRLIFEYLFRGLDVPTTWVISNGVVKIVTVDHAERLKSSRFFPVGTICDPQRPLAPRKPQADILVLNGVRQDALGKPKLDLGPVIRLTTSGIWQQDDPEAGGSINQVGNQLVVRQTSQVLDEVEGILNGLRAAAAGKLRGGTYQVRDPFYDHQADASARRALQKSISVNFQRVKIKDALADIGKRIGVKFILDPAAILSGDIVADQRVSLNLKSCTARAAVNLILEQHFDGPLTIVQNEGVITVVTEEHADSIKQIVIYDIRDLTAHGIEEAALVSAIRDQTSGIWQDDDPEAGGAVAAVAPVGAMIVRQTDKVHEEISELFAALRARLRESERKNADGAAKPTIGDDTVVTRFYPFLFKDRATAMQTAITRTVAPKSWNAKGADAAISLVEGTLVIRQTVKVHREIRDLLQKIDTAERLGNRTHQLESGVP